jgi:hypothetical protein
MPPHVAVNKVAYFYLFGIRRTVQMIRNEALKFGAGDRGRTGDVQLGKLAFYR